MGTRGCDPHGRMSEEAVQQWTDAIDEDEEGPRAHRGGG